MRAYLKSVDVWYIVQSGWNDLDKTIAKLSRSEKIDSSTNDKELNAIFTSIFAKKFARIDRCVIAKAAWETLKITHEGSKIVKTSEIQMLRV